MLLCKLANICGLNHNKYISYEYWNLQIYEIEIIRNTKFWVTPRCPSHRCQMRRGTPLTRSWFMPALNTQRFATVLTHQLTCFSHAEYHFCVTVYQPDVKSELQSVCKHNLKFNGFSSFIPHSHIHRHAYACRIPLLRDCLSIWYANWDIKWSQTLTLTGFNFFPEQHLTGFTILSQTQTSIDMHRHAEYHYCVTVYRSDVQYEKQSEHKCDTYGF